jgi:glyoxylase-like metal-dependent hydrolase (beta-lactamase superfamily II)
MTKRDQSALQTVGLPPVTAEGEALPSDPRRISYTAIQAPQFGAHTRVNGTVSWTRVPLPIDLNHINVWLIESDRGYLLVDTGMSASMCKDAWERLEASAFETARPLALFVTHVHPDHIGLAGWLQDRYSIPVWMSERSHELAQAVYGASAPTSAEIEAFLRAHGVNDATVLQPMFKPERFARMTTGMPRVARYVGDSEPLEWGEGEWCALRTDGHADGHLCLWNEREHILISGDQVLPTISSNISIMFQQPNANPLGAYLASLDRLRELPLDTLVLPSHGLPFYGLQQRIDDLRGHHEAQVAKLLDACSMPLSAFETLPILFRRELAGMHFLLALGEAVAHLEYLAHRGDLERRTRGEVVTYRRG